MTWSELANLRTRRSRTYEDAGTQTRALVATIGPLHYQSVLDSGTYDTPIDATPQRVDVASFDGWRVTAADWHYALGKDLENHGDQDGWVAFGGRQGAHWFKFRLLRTGYLHWPTREWDDVGSAPTYNRANLSQETQTTTLQPNDDQIPRRSLATWSQLWTTPGGGAVDARWTVTGDRLKEEITLNQPGREWIAANHPPETPPSETWFGFVFQLDWSDVPRVYRDGILQDLDGDFADDGAEIALRDAQDRLLALVPLGHVTVGENGPKAQLRQRFWKDEDDYYLLIGVRCDVLNGLPAGPLVFDPSLNPTIAASEDDSYEATDGSTDHTETENRFQSADEWGGFRFSIAVPQGASVTDATLSLYFNNANRDNANFTIYCEDEDTAAAFDSSNNDVSGRSQTSATASWVDGDVVGGTIGYGTSPSFTSAAQEVISRGGWSSGNYLGVLLECGGSCDSNIYFYDKVGDDPQLYIEWTTGAATGQPIMLRATTVPGMRQWHPRI